MDGVDCALIESDGHGAKAVGQAVHMAYSPDLRHQIVSAMAEAAAEARPNRKSKNLNQLERALTLIHAQAVTQLLAVNGLSHKDVHVVGFHGQTLRHQPAEGWSWQIGDGALLANEIDIPVVNDFRRQDVESGGQGAPLVPIYHQALIQALPKSVNASNYPMAIVNIGGVSNVTWIGKAGHMLAFDTGPGNALIDDWVRQHTGEPMDQDGRYAAEGKSDLPLLKTWMAEAYFTQIPPKSLDRQAFSVQGLERLSLTDGAATLLDFTVKTIEAAFTHCPERPQHIYICGGGRHNKILMSKLARGVIPVDAVEKLGWRGDFLEAEAFGFLACRYLLGLPITFPGTTGTARPLPGGTLCNPTLGQNKA